MLGNNAHKFVGNTEAKRELFASQDYKKIREEYLRGLKILKTTYEETLEVEDYFISPPQDTITLKCWYILKKTYDKVNLEYEKSRKDEKEERIGKAKQRTNVYKATKNWKTNIGYLGKDRIVSGKSQYNIQLKKPNQLGLDRASPKAYRVSFVMDDRYDDNAMTVSHLCHNTDCFNPKHHVLETLEVNKSRNGCPGGNHCHHRVKCIRPGEYYNM